ncbi:MAG TPA: hypothetical protein VGQ53_22440 [Chitinophagaceae bacterium]|jgi:hypothetical protein|nr:hypothetical protein [Chitinophagaceae bacterium]
MKFVNNPTQLILTLFLFTIIAVFSCKKETSDTSAQDETFANISATESNAEADDVFNGVFDDVLGVNANVGMGGTGIFGRKAGANNGTSYADGRIDNTGQLPPCLNIIISQPTPNAFPITITFDFGSTGCVANDGFWRKGKIVVEYSNHLLIPGATASVKFEDFQIGDSIAIDNSTNYTITNTGTQDNLQFTVDVSARLSKPNGNYSEWYSHKTISRIAGNLTSSPLDDVLKIEGRATGKTRRNDLLVAWKAEITDPFIKKFTCRWISKGTIKTGRENLASNSQWFGVLDYGSGNCDNRATLTINGIKYEITLR